MVQSQNVLECHKKNFLLSEDKINVHNIRHTCMLVAKHSLYFKQPVHIQIMKYECLQKYYSAFPAITCYCSIFLWPPSGSVSKCIRVPQEKLPMFLRLISATLISTPAHKFPNVLHTLYFKQPIVNVSVKYNVEAIHKLFFLWFSRLWSMRALENNISAIPAITCYCSISFWPPSGSISKYIGVPQEKLPFVWR